MARSPLVAPRAGGGAVRFWVWKYYRDRVEHPITVKLSSGGYLRFIGECERDDYLSGMAWARKALGVANRGLVYVAYQYDDGWGEVIEFVNGIHTNYPTSLRRFDLRIVREVAKWLPVVEP
jgi:hypothetical protein